MGSHVVNDQWNNTVCSCSYKCCFLEGCCFVHPRRSLEEKPVVDRYVPVAPFPTRAFSARPGKSFLDFPPELRNIVYRKVLYTKTTRRMTLNPTLRDHAPEDRWGEGNRFALLATCRELYHEAAPMMYGNNFFSLARPLHRDFTIPRAPGMPFRLIQFFILHYPGHLGPCSWHLSHLWKHWLEDALTITSRFPNLRLLLIKMNYNQWASRDTQDWYSWDPLFRRVDKDMSDEEFASRVLKVVNSLAILNGRKMPAPVRLDFCGFAAFQNVDTEFIHPTHDIACVNEAIVMAQNRPVEYIAPMSWSERGYFGDD